MDTTAPLAPNHHAHFPGFTGTKGLLLAVALSVGRDDDATLAADLTGIAPGDDLVDIGGGTGAAARLAARRGATAIAVDPARAMLRVGRWLTRRRGVRFVEGAAETLPVPDASASVAWSLACVHHWSDLDAGIAEVRRVLRPGGRFLAMERRTQPGADGLASHGWTYAQAEAFAELCRGAGLADVRVEHHQAGRKPVVAVLARQP
jgi:ubiquinone/menaquinone biosynthesis C-methylase UbiE